MGIIWATYCETCNAVVHLGDNGGMMGEPSMIDAKASNHHNFGWIYAGLKAINLLTYEVEAYRAFLERHNGHPVVLANDDQPDIDWDTVEEWEHPDKGFIEAVYVIESETGLFQSTLGLFKPFDECRLMDEDMQMFIDKVFDVSWDECCYHAPDPYSEEGIDSLMDYLIKHQGAKLTARLVVDQALIKAVKNDNFEGKKLHTERGAYDVTADEEDRVALMDSAEAGNLEVLKRLIDQGVDVDAKNEEGDTVLMAAANAGNLEVVKILIEKGANVKAKSFYGDTALRNAASGGHFDVVRLLVEKGADVNAMAMDRWTVLQHAAVGGNLDVVKLLIEEGADVNTNVSDGSPLSTAIIFGYFEVAKLLIEKGVDVNTKEEDGWTALFHASSDGDLEMVMLLIEKGADVNAKAEDGRTAVEVANSEEIAMLLKAHR